MKRTLSFFLLISLLAVWMAGCAPAAKAEPTPTPVPATPTQSPMDAVSKLHWFGTSAILYNGSKVIYFDPISLDGKLPQADLILVTHAHSDHWSVADLKKIIGPNTTLIIGPIVSASYEVSKSDLGIPATILAEGQTTEVNGVTVEAVPAYDTIGHVKGSGGVGFIVSVDGIKMYHSGGTAAYPGMEKYNCDIAFIPVYSKDQAQAMALIIPAKVIIFEHTSYYAAKAVGDLFTQNQIGAGKTYVALEAGPYQP
jgi:L-ascorbate metabolism protein UlaG (beta-lactamase superfamily)